MFKEGKKSLRYRIIQCNVPHFLHAAKLYSRESPTILFAELFFANEKYAHGKKGLRTHRIYFLI